MSEWNIDSLKGLTGDAFEAERNRIISSYIKSLPEERRTATYAMQCKIDLARETMPNEEFLLWMVREMAEQLENLSDACVHLSHLVLGPPKTGSTV